MSIKFALYKSDFTAQPNQYRAVVQPAGTIDYNGIIDQILIHHSTITRSDILAVLDSFFLVLINMLLLGFNVKTPGLNFRVSIRGGFDGQNDSFSPGRNSVGVSISPGLRIRRGMQDVQVQKQESSERLPHLLNFTPHEAPENLKNLVTTQPHVIARARPEAISYLRIGRLLRLRLAVTCLSSNKTFRF